MPNPLLSIYAEYYLGDCFVDFDHLQAPHVCAAARADTMRQRGLATLGTLHQIGRAQRIMCTATITAAFANFSFW
jgi:hypothetical protein